MKTKSVIVIALLFAALFCTAAHADANSWAQVYADEEVIITADLTSFQDKGESFRIQERYEYLTDWTRGLVSLGKKQKIYSCVKDMEYKKSESAYKVLSVTYNNQAGAAIETEKGNNADWQYATPTSSQEKCWEAHMRYVRFKQQNM